MEKSDLRIVFMGTPDFAVESLRKLVENGYNVVGVVTAPDKPVGRHQNVLQPSPVKTYALSAGIRVLQPVRLKSEDFLAELRALKADLQIVVAFRMLPEEVWAMPRLGTFNLHASLLPQYRGAAPINWAIINGETETGVTTFFLKRDIDTGDIIKQEKVAINDDDNAEDVHNRLMVVGAKLVVDTVDSILKGDVLTVAQADIPANEELKPAPKIFKDTCCIDWTMGVKRVYDFVRGLAPSPAAWAEITDGEKNLEIKIFATRKRFKKPDETVGTIITDGKETFSVALADGYIDILQLQLSGKKRMATADFLRGFRGLADYRVVL